MLGLRLQQHTTVPLPRTQFPRRRRRIMPLNRQTHHPQIVNMLHQPGGTATKLVGVPQRIVHPPTAIKPKVCNGLIAMNADRASKQFLKLGVSLQLARIIQYGHPSQRFHEEPFRPPHFVNNLRSQVEIPGSSTQLNSIGRQQIHETVTHPPTTIIFHQHIVGIQHHLIVAAAQPVSNRRLRVERRVDSLNALPCHNRMLRSAVRWHRHIQKVAEHLRQRHSLNRHPISDTGSRHQIIPQYVLTHIDTSNQIPCNLLNARSRSSGILDSTRPKPRHSRLSVPQSRPRHRTSQLVDIRQPSRLSRPSGRHTATRQRIQRPVDPQPTPQPTSTRNRQPHLPQQPNLFQSLTPRRRHRIRLPHLDNSLLQHRSLTCRSRRRNPRNRRNTLGNIVIILSTSTQSMNQLRSRHGRTASSTNRPQSVRNGIQRNVHPQPQEKPFHTPHVDTQITHHILHENVVTRLLPPVPQREATPLSQITKLFDR